MPRRLTPEEAASAKVGGPRQIAPPSPLHPDSRVDAFLRNERRVIPEMRAADPTVQPRDLFQGGVPPFPGAPAIPPIAGGRAGPTKGEIEREVAQLAGVTFESAPIEAQRLAAFVPDITTPESARRIMSRVLGREVFARTGADTGQVEIFDPETDKVFFFDEPGLGIEDLQQFINRDLTQLGAEVGGGAAGGAVGAVPGAVLGAGAGAGIARLGQLMYGQALGLHDLTPNEMLVQSGLDAVIAGGGGAAGASISRLARRHALRALSYFSRFGEDLSDDGLAAAIANTADAIEEVGVRPSAAGIAARADLPIAGELIQAERAIGAVAGVGDALRQQARENRLVLRRRFASLEQAGGGDLDANALALAEDIRGRVLSVVDVAERQAAVLDTETLQALEREVAAATGNVEELMDLNFPETRRHAVRAIQAASEAAREASARLYDGAGGVYQIAREELADSTLSAGPVLAEATELAAVFDSTMFSQLDPVRQRTIRRAIAATSTREEGTGEVLPRQVTFEDAQRSLAFLRDTMRDIRNGTLPNVNQRVVGRLLGAMTQLRNQFTAQSPRLAEAVEAAETFARRSHDQLERSLAGRLIRVRNGVPVIGDKNFFSSVIARGNVEGSEAVAQVLTNPITAVTDEAALESAAAAREGMKRGIYELYLREVVRDGVPRADLHRKFMTGFGRVIRPWLSEGEFGRISRFRGAEQLLEEQRTAHQRIVQLAMETPEVRNVLGDNPRRASTQKVLNALWDDEAGRREILQLARQSPEMQARLRGVAYQKLKRSMAKVAGTNDFDYRGIGRFLDEHEGAMRDLFGREHVANLRTLQKAAEVARVEAPRAERPTTVDRLLDDVLRGALSPLSPVTRISRRFIRRYQLQSRRLTAEALANPKLLQDLLRRRSVPRTRAHAILGAVVATHGIEGVDALLERIPTEGEVRSFGRLRAPGTATLSGPRVREATR